MHQQPLAILGYGCRLPGGIVDGESFWRILEQGYDTITEIPPDRWNIQRFYSAQPGVPGKSNARWGGFLDAIDQFEPECFGISPREAAYVDPQQRLLLETTWEALEMAGLRHDLLAGSRTGVFIGISTGDYGQIQQGGVSFRNLSPFSAHGSTLSIAANRISYCLDLKGPSFIVDTACSSSLVALDRAVQSVRAGESDLAIVGGVNVIIGPQPFISFSTASMLSPDGRCKSFDASANGFVRSEGAGVIVIKRLEEALRDGDPIQAVIVASGVNQDGRTGGLSMPSGEAQEALLREVYSRAGIDTREVGYVEAHGTGTAVGDPIEAGAIGRALGQGRGADGFCLMGSLKSNIGHLEAGSGIASVIKVILLLQKRLIPPSIHFHNPNPHIPFEELRLRVPTTLQPLPANRRALVGVNSFGFGGTNAHVVLSDYSPAAQPRAVAQPQQAVPVLLTARNGESLKELAAAWVPFLMEAEQQGVPLADIAKTAVVRRSHYSYRLGFSARTHAEACDLLRAFAAGESRPGMFTAQSPSAVPRVAFVFAGQGPQWYAMGRELASREPIFREALEECETLLRREVGWSLLEELSREEAESRIGQTSMAQPALFAIQYGLAKLWEAWGVHPQVVLGHSVGEVAAACIAGHLSLEAAVRIIAHRGRCLEQCALPGRMLAVATSQQEVGGLLNGHADVSVAAVNSPQMVTLAGAPEAIEKLTERLGEREVWCKPLRVSHAFHTALVEPARNQFREAVQEVTPQPGRLEMISTVTGQGIEAAALGPDYWWGNIRRPVQFQRAMETLQQSGVEIIVEIGPHPVLTGSIRQCLGADQTAVAVVPSLTRDHEHQTLISSLAGVFVHGLKVDWESVLPQRTAWARLPLHPVRKKRYWSEDPQVFKGRLPKVQHPLLGAEVTQHTWQTVLDKKDFTWLTDHRAGGQITFPAAGYVEMFSAAAAIMLGTENTILDDLNIQRGLFLTSEAIPEIQLTGDPVSGRMQISSRLGSENGNWVLHGQAMTRSFSPLENPPRLNLDEWAGMPNDLSPEEFYALTEQIGLDYGETFRGVRAIRRGLCCALARIELPLADRNSQYRIHPARLDSCFQAALAAVPPEFVVTNGVYLPERIRRVRFFRTPGQTLWSEIRVRSITSLQLTFDARVYNEDGELAIELTEFRCRNVAIRGKASISDGMIEQFWFHQPLPEQPAVTEPLRLARPLEAMLEQAHQERSLACYDLDGLLEFTDRISLKWVALALEQCGLDLTPGASLDLEPLFASGRLVEQHRRQIERCLDDLAQVGVLRRSAGMDVPSWQVVSTFDTDMTADARNCLSQYPQSFPMLMLGIRCGLPLTEIWTGRLDALKVLFAEEVVEVLEQLYDFAGYSQYSNTLCQQFLLSLIDQLPAERPLRVLEIGAGTGGTASHVLPVLPATRTEYWFTDVSTYFLARAESRFRNYEFVQYKLLDLERDFPEQGTPAGYFDVIIASNVLHSLTNICAAVARCRQALVPGGLLMLTELCSQRPSFNLSFGLTDGWWNDRHDPYRRDGLLLRPDAWIRLLQESGFAQAEATPYPEVTHATVVVARTPLDSPVPAAPTAPTDSPALAGKWLVFSDGSSGSRELVSRIRRHGGRCLVVHPGAAFQEIEPDLYTVAPGRLDDMQRLAELHRPRAGEAPAHVVHLWASRFAGTEPDFSAAENEICLSLQALVQTFANSSPVGIQKLYLVSRGATLLGEHSKAGSFVQAELLGIGRVITSEFPEVQVRAVDLDPAADDIDALWSELLAADIQRETVWRSGHRYIPRLEFARQRLFHTPQPPETFPFELAPARSGDVSSLELVECSVPELGPRDLKIEVLFTALNFRDLLKMLGTYPGDEPWQLALGDEATGRVLEVGPEVRTIRPGDMVLASGCGCFRSQLIIPEAHALPLSANFGTADAVTLFAAFATAHYALVQVGRLQATDSVLIHSAAGGVGLAAIQVARQIGARIIATAGSETKRELVRRLGADVVLNSRTLDFSDQILELTQGRGVDVVLNSLAGRTMERSLACLAPYGRFLELGKRDFFENTQIGLWPFRQNISYHCIDLAAVLNDRPGEVFSMLQSRMSSGAEHKVSPLPYRIFPVHQAREAFRLMSQGGHIGKLVLDMKQTARRVRRSPRPMPMRADRTYLIAGAFGGVGMALARHLADRGARHMVMLGRSGPKSEQAQLCIGELAARGVNVQAVACDIVDGQQLQALLGRLRESMPAFAGVFQLAMVIDDVTLLNMTPDQVRQVLRPKVNGTWNLHRLTLGDPLELFVMFGSLSSVVGQFGQANYTAANCALDALALHRRVAGLPATTIGWGLVGEVGYVAERPDLASSLALMGFESLPLSDVWEALDWAVSPGAPPLCFAPRADWRKLSQKMRAAGQSNGVLERLLTAEDQSLSDSQTGGFLEILAEAEPERKLELIRGYVANVVARILGTSSSSLEMRRPLTEMGLDSLMGVELANTFEVDLGVSVPLGSLSREMTADKLAQMLAQILLGETALPEGDQPATADTATRTPQPRLVPLTEEVTAPTLYCLHPSGGDLLHFNHLAAELAGSCRVVGVESRLLSGAATEYATTEEMAAAYAELIAADRANGQPLHLFGFSLGGIIALQTAALLEQQGREVKFVGLAECNPDWGVDPETRIPILAGLLVSLLQHLDESLSLLRPGVLDHLAGEATQLARELVEHRSGEVLLRWLAQSGRLNEGVSFEAVQDYVQRLGCHLGLLAGSRSASPLKAPILAWKGQAGLTGATRHPAVTESAVLPGTHFDILLPPNSEVIGQELRERMNC